MLRGGVLHPQLVSALAAAGHGSLVLIADANYPHATGVSETAERVFLNLRPGLVDAPTVLDAVLELVPAEAAFVMSPGQVDPPVFDAFAARMPGVELERLDRHDFYAVARSADLAVAIATGETALFGNVILRIGVVESAR